MTGLFAADQNGLFGDRFLTHHTWFGLSHEVKGSLVGLLDWIIHECENMKWDGGFYRETKGSRGRGRHQ